MPFGNVKAAALIALAAIVPATRATHAQERVDNAMVARIRAEGLDRSQVGALFNHLTNVIGPRLTGSPAYLMAAQWSRDRLTGWGLANAHLDAWPFGPGWTLEKLTLEMTAPRYFPLVGYPDAWSPPTKGVLNGKPIYLGDKSAAEIEAMGEQLRGAIVLPVRPQATFIRADRAQPAASDTLVRIGAPPMLAAPSATPYRTMLPILQRYGAGAVLRPNQGEHGTLFVLGAQGNQRASRAGVPSVILSAEQYNAIVNGFTSGSPVELRVEVAVKYHDADTNSYNVIADIPGSDPALRNEVVLIGAHLDSWHSSPGATDNADGAASMLEAMRILKALGVTPRRTIRVALWGGEEQGLLGSRAYADRYLRGDANAAARAAISVYFNDDPGTGKTYGFYTENSAPAKAILDAWLAPLRDLGYARNVNAPIGNTDHLTFTGLGIPGFTAIKDYQDYDVRTHHTNVDFAERVTVDDLKQSAIVMAVIAYHAAMRDGDFPRPAPRQ